MATLVNGAADIVYMQNGVALYAIRSLPILHGFRPTLTPPVMLNQDVFLVRRVHNQPLLDQVPIHARVTACFRDGSIDVRSRPEP